MRGSHYALVNHATALGNVSPELPDSPDEVLAVAAERRLFEEARDEAVIVDLGDILLLERAHSLARLARLVLGVAIVDGARHGGRAGQRHDGDGARSALKQV